MESDKVELMKLLSQSAPSPVSIVMLFKFQQIKYFLFSKTDISDIFELQW